MSKTKEKFLKPEFGKYPVLISGGWTPLSTASEHHETPLVSMTEMSSALAAQVTNKFTENENVTQQISAIGYLGCAKKVAVANESCFIPASIDCVNTLSTPVPNIIHSMADSVGTFEHEGVMSYPIDPHTTCVRYILCALGSLRGQSPGDVWDLTRGLTYDITADVYRLAYSFYTGNNCNALSTYHLKAINRWFAGKPLKFDMANGNGNMKVFSYVVDEFPSNVNVGANDTLAYFGGLLPNGVAQQGFDKCAQIIRSFPDLPDFIDLLVNDRHANKVTGHNLLTFNAAHVSGMVNTILDGISLTVRKYQQKLAVRSIEKFDKNGSVAQMGYYDHEKSRCFAFHKMTPVDLCLVAMCDYRHVLNPVPRYESIQFNRLDILRQYGDHSKLKH